MAVYSYYALPQQQQQQQKRQNQQPYTVPPTRPRQPLSFPPRLSAPVSPSTLSLASSHGDTFTHRHTQQPAPLRFGSRPQFPTRPEEYFTPETDWEKVAQVYRDASTSYLALSKAMLQYVQAHPSTMEQFATVKKDMIEDNQDAINAMTQAMVQGFEATAVTGLDPTMTDTPVGTVLLKDRQTDKPVEANILITVGQKQPPEASSPDETDKPSELAEAQPDTDLAETMDSPFDWVNIHVVVPPGDDSQEPEVVGRMNLHIHGDSILLNTLSTNGRGVMGADYHPQSHGKPRYGGVGTALMQIMMELMLANPQLKSAHWTSAGNSSTFYVQMGAQPAGSRTLISASTLSNAFTQKLAPHGDRIIGADKAQQWIQEVFDAEGTEYDAQAFGDILRQHQRDGLPPPTCGLSMVLNKEDIPPAMQDRITQTPLLADWLHARETSQ